MDYDDDFYFEDDDNKEYDLLDHRKINSPKQVLTVSEIRPLAKYRIHLANKVLEVFFEGMEETSLGTKIKSRFGPSYYLADIGILPYPNDKWNPTNWVEEI